MCLVNVHTRISHWLTYDISELCSQGEHEVLDNIKANDAVCIAAKTANVLCDVYGLGSVTYIVTHIA